MSDQPPEFTDVDGAKIVLPTDHTAVGSAVRVLSRPSKMTVKGTPSFTGWVVGWDEDERNGRYLIVEDDAYRRHPVKPEHIRTRRPSKVYQGGATRPKKRKGKT